MLDINVVGEKASLGSISLSKLSAIKQTNFSDYVSKICGDKVVRCSKCLTLKNCWGAHMIGTESYVAHQLNYFKYVNMQEVHCNDYYTNRALLIVRPLKVLTIIHDRMNHAKQLHHVLCIESRLRMDSKLPVLVTSNTVFSNIS